MKSLITSLQPTFSSTGSRFTTLRRTAAATLVGFLLRALTSFAATTIDWDPPLPLFGPVLEVSEDAGTAHFRLLREGDLSLPVTLNYSTQDGTARAGVAYEPAAGKLTFAPGETVKDIAVRILDNAAPDANRSFIIQISPEGKIPPLSSFPRDLAVEIADNEIPDTLDPTFNANLRDEIASVSLQADGKILVLHPSSWAGPGRVLLRRLNEDGTLDSTFVPPAQPLAALSEGFVVSALTNGNALVAGQVNLATGLSAGSVLIVGPTGALLNQYQFQGNSIWEGSVALVYPDGKILQGDSTVAPDRGRTLRRLNVDGAVDPDFVPPVFAARRSEVTVLIRFVDKLAAHLQAERGSIPVGPRCCAAQISRRRSSAAPPELSSNRISTEVTTYFNALRLQPDGRILVAGHFNEVNGSPLAFGLVRLNANGSLDAGFLPYDNCPTCWPDVASLLLQTDGKILIHRAYGDQLIRLHEDGSLDHSFDLWRLPELAEYVNEYLRLEALLPTGEPIIRTPPWAGDDLLWKIESDGSRAVAIARVPGFYRDVRPESDAQSRLLLYGWSWRYFSHAFDKGLPVSTPAVNGWPVGNLVRLRLAPEPPGSFRFEAPAFAVAESAGQAVVVVRRLGVSSNAVSVSYHTADGTARAGRDYQPVNGTLDFGPLVTMKTFVVPVIDNAAPEADRTVLLTLSQPTAGFSIWPRPAELRILDDERPGSLDPGFAPEVSAWFIFDGIFPPVSDLALTASGQIFIGGSSFFTSVNGVRRHHLARLLPDGSLDLSYVPRPSTDKWFSAFERAGSSLLLQPDGMVWSHGENPQRLDTEGAVNLSFADGRQILAIQPDGKLIGLARTNFVRWLPDGRLDDSFNGADLQRLPFTPSQFAFTSNGDVLIVEYPNTVLRLKPDGSRDSSFRPIQFDATINSLALAPDGRIYVASEGDLVRLMPDGSLDAGFQIPDFDGGQPYAQNFGIAVQPDGKVLVPASVAQSKRVRLLRLHPDGSEDTTFDSGTGALGPATWISDILVQPDGQILICGDFTEYNGLTRYGIARLNGDGRLLRVHAPRAAPDGAIEIQVSGISGQAVVLEATDSLSPANWQAVARGSIESGSLNLRIPRTITTGQQFFRAVQMPGRP